MWSMATPKWIVLANLSCKWRNGGVREMPWGCLQGKMPWGCLQGKRCREGVSRARCREGVSRARDAVRVSPGQDAVRVSPGQDAVRVSPGQDAVRVSPGQEMPWGCLQGKRCREGVSRARDAVRVSPGQEMPWGCLQGKRCREGVSRARDAVRVSPGQEMPWGCLLYTGAVMVFRVFICKLDLKWDHAMQGGSLILYFSIPLQNLSYKVCGHKHYTEASILVRLTLRWNPGPRFCRLNLWISFL